jgi:protein tyrosine phosphatase (PTP) superfamily phosphohydrolase (DUF442 family)
VNVPRFIRRIFRAPYDGLRHAGVVERGVLYRCGQPTPVQLGELIDRYALKTVVSLRGTRPSDHPDAWEQAERGICRQKGVDFVSLPCNHRNPPSAEQVERFLDLMRDARRHPVLVHCRVGQQRTLLFCALYRVRIQGVARVQLSPSSSPPAAGRVSRVCPDSGGWANCWRVAQCRSALGHRVPVRLVSGRRRLGSLDNAPLPLTRVGRLGGRSRRSSR